MGLALILIPAVFGIALLVATPGRWRLISVRQWLDSRAGMIRISSIGRMEYRQPDSSVNPYLSHTALIAAMEDGLARKIDSGDPLTIDNPRVATFDVMPMTLGDAIVEFEGSEMLKKTFPAPLRDVFIDLKRDEWSRYCGIITEWEFAQYWETLP